MTHRYIPIINRAILVAASLAFGVGTTAHATDYSWGGGNLNWTDTSASGWNGGPPANWNGDSATITSGTVTTTAENNENGIAITLGGTGGLNTAGGYFAEYTSLSFVNGGTLTAGAGDATWGAGALASFSVSGSSSAGSVINGTFFNVWDGSSFNVADVTGNAAADLTISALLNRLAFQPSASITKTGAGTLTLSANNVLNNIGSVTIADGAISQTTGASWNQLNNLTLQGGTLESVSTSLTTFGCYWLPGTVTISGSSVSAFTTVGSGVQFINLGDLGSSTGTTTFNVADATSSSAADLEVSTTLGNEPFGGAAGLIKTGEGTMTLSANNIYAAGTTVNNGVLVIAGSSTGNGYIRGTVTVSSGAELCYTGGDGTGFGFNGGNKVDTLNINGGLVDSQFSAHLYGTTVNMTAGELRVNGGVSSPVGDLIHWNNTTVNTSASGSTATISGRINLRGDGGYSSAAFTVADGGAATDLLVSAAVTESNGSVGIAKSGAGTMELTGANSYHSATQVNVGKLLINGDNSAATGAVTVASGATLGGSGTVGGATTISGTHTPGNSPGIHSFASNLHYTSTSTIEWDLAGSATGARGAGYDGVNVAGALTGDAGGTFKVVLNSGAFADAFWNTNQSWSDIFKAGVDGSGSPISFDGVFSAIQWFEGTTNMTSLTGTDGYFTINGSSLNWTAVPEPTSASAGLLLVAGVLRRRRGAAPSPGCCAVAGHQQCLDFHLMAMGSHAIAFDHASVPFFDPSVRMYSTCSDQQFNKSSRSLHAPDARMS